MEPRLFRQRLLELATEYEGLHAGAPREHENPRAGAPAEAAAAIYGVAPSDVAVTGISQQPTADGVVALRGAEWLAQGEVVGVTAASLGRLSGRSSTGTAPLELPRRPSSVARSEDASPTRAGVRSETTRGWNASVGERSPGGGTDLDMDVQRTITSLRQSCHARDHRPSRRSWVDDSNVVAQVVHSHNYTLLLSCLIIGSALLIGIETHVTSASSQGRKSEQVSMVFSGLNYVVTFLFTVEIVARLYVFRFDFFVTDPWWNLFDLVIVFLAIVEVAMEIIVNSFAESKESMIDSGGMAKMMRLVRLTRLLRLVRTFRQLKPLRILVRSIMAAGKSVFWAFLLLIMIIFSFGVILTQAVTEHTKGGTQVNDDDLISYYGDLVRSMVSLWMAVSGGISWIELTRPLEGTGNSIWTVMFLVYILIVYFFILNVVTGVFCQNAIEGAAADLELTLDFQIREKQVHVERLALLFHEMNQDTEDRDNQLTPEELQLLMVKPKVRAWFKSLEIDARDHRKLFKIIDTDESGGVSIEEFVEGCLSLRGSATRVDVEELKWEIRHAERLAHEDRQKLLMAQQQATTGAELGARRTTPASEATTRATLASDVGAGRATPLSPGRRATRLRIL